MKQEFSRISKFPETRTTSRGELKFSERISGNFLFHSILNRNLRKFWSNGTRPSLSATYSKSFSLYFQFLGEPCRQQQKLKFSLPWEILTEHCNSPSQNIPFFQNADSRFFVNTIDCEQSLFSSKIRGKECKTRKHASVTVSVTWERRCREPLVAWALGDEWKERLHWFHTTIWCYFDR